LGAEDTSRSILYELCKARTLYSNFHIVYFYVMS